MWPTLIKDESFVEFAGPAKGKACGILVDTEPKVVQRIASEMPELFYDYKGKGNVMYT